MRTTIDRAGRLVIPEPLRDRVGLATGGEVDLELDGASVRIAPVTGRDLKEERGLLVIPSAGTPVTLAVVRTESMPTNTGAEAPPAAARQHSRPLVTGDAPAKPVYEALGVEIEIVL